MIGLFTTGASMFIADLINKRSMSPDATIAVESAASDLFDELILLHGAIAVSGVYTYAICRFLACFAMYMLSLFQPPSMCITSGFSSMSWCVAAISLRNISAVCATIVVSLFSAPCTIFILIAYGM